MDIVKLFTDADLNSLYIVNALLCFVGAIWVCGVQKADRDLSAFNGWLLFWVGTGIYYCFLMAFSHWPFWGHQLGLYIATMGLIYPIIIKKTAIPERVVILGSALLVSFTALIDILLVEHYSTFAISHQILTFFALAYWAWEIRSLDSSKSVLMLTYALVQLPIFQIMYILGVEQNRPFQNYLVVSYSIYAAMKLALIPPVCVAVQNLKRGNDLPIEA